MGAVAQDRAWRVKLCDFGLCSARNNTAGTPNYMSPELLAGKPYNEKVDVYAFGLVLWEMVSREVPFDGTQPGDIKTAVGLARFTTLFCSQNTS